MEMESEIEAGVELEIVSMEMLLCLSRQIIRNIFVCFSIKTSHAYLSVLLISVLFSLSLSLTSYISLCHTLTSSLLFSLSICIFYPFSLPPASLNTIHTIPPYPLRLWMWIAFLLLKVTSSLRCTTRWKISSWRLKYRLKCRHRHT